MFQIVCSKLNWPKFAMFVLCRLSAFCLSKACKCGSWINDSGVDYVAKSTPETVFIWHKSGGQNLRFFEYTANILTKRQFEVLPTIGDRRWNGSECAFSLRRWGQDFADDLDCYCSSSLRLCSSLGSPAMCRISVLTFCHNKESKIISYTACTLGHRFS